MELGALAISLDETLSAERIRIMAEDLTCCGVPTEFVVAAISGWRNGDLARARRREFAHNRTYLEDRKPGTVDLIEARFFPKTPQIVVLATELAHKKHADRIESFLRAERKAKRSLEDWGIDSWQYKREFDNRHQSFDLGPKITPRMDLPSPSLKAQEAWTRMLQSEDLQELRGGLRA